MHKALIQLKVNGETLDVAVKPHQTLLDTLRDTLDLTGTKHGCDIGDCGTCTVLLDGIPTLSCLTLALEVQGREITTVEGVAKNGVPHPLQVAFDQQGAAQCGYCTPGFIMAGTALLAENPSPSLEEIKHALSGNLCRCTGYTKIIAAVQQASALMAASAKEV
jgi:carbon-monoxide dehydrogenase small subunit